MGPSSCSRCGALNKCVIQKSVQNPPVPMRKANNQQHPLQDLPAATTASASQVCVCAHTHTHWDGRARACVHLPD